MLKSIDNKHYGSIREKEDGDMRHRIQTTKPQQFINITGTVAGEVKNSAMDSVL